MRVEFLLLLCSACVSGSSTPGASEVDPLQLALESASEDCPIEVHVVGAGQDLDFSYAGSGVVGEFIVEIHTSTLTAVEVLDRCGVDGTSTLFGPGSSGRWSSTDEYVPVTVPAEVFDTVEAALYQAHARDGSFYSGGILVLDVASASDVVVVTPGVHR